MTGCETGEAPGAGTKDCTECVQNYQNNEHDSSVAQIGEAGLDCEGALTFEKADDARLILLIPNGDEIALFESRDAAAVDLIHPDHRAGMAGRSEADCHNIVWLRELHATAVPGLEQASDAANLSDHRLSVARRSGGLLRLAGKKVITEGQGACREKHDCQRMVFYASRKREQQQDERNNKKSAERR